MRKGLVKMSRVPLNRYAYYLSRRGSSSTDAPQAAFGELQAICAAGDFVAGRVVARNLLGVVTPATIPDAVR